MRELFFEYLGGMIGKGVTPDVAAKLASELIAQQPTSPSTPKQGSAPRRPKKSPPTDRQATEEELDKILAGVSWPATWKDAIAQAAEAAGIKPGRAKFKLMALVKQKQIQKEGELYHRAA
jgi:hypothetical protein